MRRPPATGTAAITPGAVLLMRLTIAAAQSVALYGLMGSAVRSGEWLNTHPALFAPALLVTEWVPVLLMLGVGYLGPAELAVWAIGLAAALASIGWYQPSLAPAAPNFGLWMLVAPLLFALNVVVWAYRRLPSIAARIAFASSRGTPRFTPGMLRLSAYWVIFFILTSLTLQLLKQPESAGFLPWLLRRPWFHLPMLALATATAIHATDVYFTAIRNRGRRKGQPQSANLDPGEIPAWMAERAAEQTARELERRIADMAPATPDIFRLYEAIKLLEHAWGLDLAIKLDLPGPGQPKPVIRRTTRGRYGGAYYNLGVDDDGRYRNAIMLLADMYSETYPDFVAAAYGFLEATPGQPYRGSTDTRSG